MPSCNVEALTQRAKLLSDIRLFFANQGVLEVETPLLCSSTGTDPQLDFFSMEFSAEPNKKTMFLQTSPEFAMKRLLAAGSGSIYQICKAFRNGETGRQHNPEFTLLEWYRVGFSLQHLMLDVVELFGQLSIAKGMIEGVEYSSYSDVFKSVTGLDALDFAYDEYCSYAEQNGLADAVTVCEREHALWLDLIFSYKIQPNLKKNSLHFIYGYPAIQSSLARVNENNHKIVDRFEVFLNGVELGNGYNELTDSVEQEQRFDDENRMRKQRNLPVVNKDRFLIDALKVGLPQCSGVAIGIDRLLMVLGNFQQIDEVIAFPLQRA